METNALIALVWAIVPTVVGFMVWFMKQTSRQQTKTEEKTFEFMSQQVRASQELAHSTAASMQQLSEAVYKLTDAHKDHTSRMNEALIALTAKIERSCKADLAKSK